jgi:hypothetical protein
VEPIRVRAQTVQEGPPTRRHWASLAAVLVLFALSCAVASQRSGAPHSWWSERGPVVPHESFPADCSLCHEGEGWRSIRKDFVFDHEAQTGVKLDGAHRSAECLRCHNDRGPVALFAARGCAGCHENVHRGQLGDNCESCHTQVNWRPNEAIAAHNRTRFPLVGAHAVAGCWRCHPGAQSGNFARADTSCVACHAKDLARAANPDHVAQGWVDACEQCHLPTQWSGRGFTHTTWPLVGRHQDANCVQCHQGGVFAGTPTQCVDCHLADYQNANEPDHVAFGFSTQCEQCHTPAGWELANFRHTGINSGCVQCHLSDYQTATNPNHITAGFGQTCEQCHTSTNNWDSVNFPHPQFPITNGDHAGLSCQECHTTPNNYQLFSCTHCHEHRQSEMDNEHDDVNGYVWQSAACYQCHPNGKKD